MSEPQVHDVTPDTLPLLEAGLKLLAADLGDPYETDSATLHDAMFGPNPSCAAAIVTDAGDALIGAALYSPVFSTVQGGAGVYVSDLWVSPDLRGHGLGPLLLCHVASRAQTLWKARFLRLISYAENLRARAFYARLGFDDHINDLVLQLSGDGLEKLKERR